MRLDSLYARSSQIAREEAMKERALVSQREQSISALESKE